MKFLAVLTSLLILLLALAGCDDAQLTGKIISTDINGFADDGDSGNPREDYRGPGDMDAVDVETRSSSDQATFNTLGGRAKALPTDPASNTLTSDVAQAASYNKVVTELVVKKAGRFTFDIKQTIEDIELVHDGRLAIGIRANILDAQGQTLPNGAGGIASLDYEMKSTGQAKYVVEINGDTNNPDSTSADKKYNKTASGPSGGAQLAAGNYQIEFELRIRATAPIQVGPDGRKHEARVGKATVKIELR
jgi:hypothetical protein